MKTLKQRQAETGRTLSLNGVKWRRLRAAVLEREPLCRDCYRRGRLTTATDVDHQDNDPSNNDPENLVSLCHECHSRKTQADMGKRVTYGCDINGMPLDPLHPGTTDDDTRTADTAAALDVESLARCVDCCVAKIAGNR